MSPRAAARLATLGFSRVYDYAAGKADWGSFNLPLEGREGSETRAAAHAGTDVPTCRLGDRLPDVKGRISRAGWDTCFVLDPDGILIGRLDRTALQRDDDVSVEAAMTPGPSTIRPSARLEAIVSRMRDQDLTSLPVTRSDGRVVGLLLRADAEQALESHGTM